jgi:23S rRNA (guanosine2251-2'-O)-methyltransferase
VGGEQVEGRQAVRELLLAGRRRVHELLVASADGRAVAPDLVDLAVELHVPVREMSRTKLDAEARTESPQGVVARAAPLPETPLHELVVRAEGGPPPFLIALDGVTDPQNVGAILRSALCAGVTGALLPRHRAATVTPAATKAAAGAVEHLPMTLVGGMPATLGELKDQGLWIVGLDGGGTDVIDSLRLADEPLVLVVGGEGKGLTRLVRARCDTTARIPMAGPLGSLNAGVAASVACFEVARLRRERAVRK